MSNFFGLFRYSFSAYFRVFTEFLDLFQALLVFFFLDVISLLVFSISCIFSNVCLVKVFVLSLSLLLDLVFLVLEFSGIGIFRYRVLY